MANDEIIVSIGADVSGLNTGLNDAAKSLGTITLKFTDARKAAESLGEGMTRGGAAFEEAKLAAGAMTGSVEELARGFSKLAAESPIVSEALRAAIPALALVAAAEVFHEISDKVHEYEEALRKAHSEVTNLAIATGEESKSIDIENLKLEDQISKLENRPTRNNLKIAIMEAEEEADKLAVKIDQDLAKLATNLQGGAGPFTSFFSAFQKVNEEAVGKQIEPLERQYQLAVLAKDATAQHNALLAVQAALEKAVGEAQTQYATARNPNTGKLQQSEIRKEDTAALQDFQQALQAVNNLLSDEGKIQEQGNLRNRVAIDEQKKDVDTLWAKYIGGFEKNAAEVKKSDEMWKKFYADRAAEAIKNTEQESNLAIEGQKRMSEQMAAISKRDVDITLADADREVKIVEDSLKQIQAAREAATTGHTGTFKEIIDTQQSHAGMAQLKTDMQDIEQQINALQGYMAKIQSQPFLSIADQTNVDNYAKKIEQLKTVLDGLQQQYTKLQTQTLTTFQQIQGSMERAIDAGFNSFNSGFIKMIEGGQGFVRTMQQLWTGLATSFIESVLKMGEKWIATEILKLAFSKSSAATSTALAVASNRIIQESAAGAAAAEAMATTPFPLDLVVGPAVFSIASAFEKGGIVPGMTGQAVPALVHAGEGVLPQHLTNFLVNAASNSSGNAGHSVHVNYSPNISTIDSRGMSDVLRDHADLIEESVSSAMRRRNAA